MKPWPLSLALCCLMGVAGVAQATLEVNVSKSVRHLDPIAVPHFGPAPAGQPGIAQIVRADLDHSGYFHVLPTALYPNQPHRPEQVAPGPWERSGALTVVLGSVRADGARYDIHAWVVDLMDDKVLAGRRYLVGPGAFHLVGQQIADLAYQQITGFAGPFASPIAWVAQTQGHYALTVGQSDAWAPQKVLVGRIPVISPTWSPNHRQMAYVSYRHEHSVIFLQNLHDGRRQQIPDGGRPVSAPAFSPGGEYLAFAKVWTHGRTEIVLRQLTNGHEQVLTRQGTVNTSPVWGPHGHYLYFVSNRQGSAQIYRLQLDGGQVQRLSYAGAYNVSPDIAPNGRWLTFIHADDGVLAIAIMHPDGRDLRVLYAGANCERPTFAPDSRMILFAAHRDGHKVLGEIAINGRGLHFLSTRGAANEPVWSFS